MRIEVIRSKSGDGLLRFKGAESGLCLENRLMRDEPVVKQTQRWREVFEALLARELRIRH